MRIVVILIACFPLLSWSENFFEDYGVPTEVRDRMGRRSQKEGNPTAERRTPNLWWKEWHPIREGDTLTFFAIRSLCCLPGPALLRSARALTR